MEKCGNNCTACPFIKEAKSLKINGVESKINKNLNCESFNCIYMIQCLKHNCNMSYIGETRRILKFRLAEHRGYVNTEDLSKATGEHFNAPGLNISDLSIVILEKVRSTDDEIQRVMSIATEEEHVLENVIAMNNVDINLRKNICDLIKSSQNYRPAPYWEL